MSDRRHTPRRTAKPAPPTEHQAGFEPRPFAAADQPAASAAPARIQAKLMVGAANDHYEQEADRLAAQVMSMPASDAAVEDGDAATPLAVQRAGGDAGFEAGTDIERSISSQHGGGAPLPAATRDFMEPRFGSDFGSVRVHTDTQAADMNRQLNALAFTHGQDIYLGAGSYAPGTSAGQRLLAHELTHVVQQSGPAIQRQYLGRPASGSLAQTGASHTAIGTSAVSQKSIQRFSADKFFPSDNPKTSDEVPPDARKYLNEKFKGYKGILVSAKSRNASIKLVIDTVSARTSLPSDPEDYEELVVELFNVHFASSKGAYGMLPVTSFADIRERIGAPVVAAPAAAAAEAEAEEPVDIDQDALEAYALELGLSPADIDRLKKLKDAKEGKFDFITEDGDTLALDIKAKKIKIGWGANDEEEGDSIEIGKDKVALSIGGYGVSCENKADGQAAKVDFPEIRAPAEGDWGPSLSLIYPFDPAGITRVGVRLSLTGFASLKPTLEATKTTNASTGDRTYAIRGTIVPDGRIMAAAEVYMGAGYESGPVKAEAGLFARGGVELKDSASTIKVIGEYVDNPRRATNSGSLTFANDLQGAIIAQVGAYASWTFVFASKRYEYIFKEWEMGDIAYKKSARLLVAEGAGLRLPSLEVKDSFEPNVDNIPFTSKKVTNERTPLLAGPERSDD